MKNSESRFWVRFIWPDNEEDVHCLSVPRVGEQVTLPGRSSTHVVTGVEHRLMRAADDAFIQIVIIGLELSAVPTDGAGAAQGGP